MKKQTIILVILALVSISITCWTIRNHQLAQVPAGIQIDDLILKRISLDELAKKLANKNSQKEFEYKIQFEDQIFSISSKKTGIHFENKQVLDALKQLLSNHDFFWGRLYLQKTASRNLFKFITPISYERSAVNSFFSELKKKLDSHSRSAKLDLIKKKVIPGKTGIIVDITNSISRFEKMLQHDQKKMKLIYSRKKPKLSNNDLENLNLNKVLGWYKTSYYTWGKYENRAHNLRIGGAKLTGSIILPGKSLSFNKVIGPRTAKKGYRVAPIIALGELVEGMGGGMCQIASTLFAASFFAGLDILHAKPHSQPSHYIDLGLDATVVYPSVDLVIRNPYDFPIVIRTDVSGGVVKIEILGKEKPYDKITFIRKIISEKPFKTTYRKDEKLLKGVLKVKQRGQKGYVVRRRAIYKDKKGYELKSHTWTLHYPPTTMIINKGTKPPENPEEYVPPEPEEFKPKPDPQIYRLEEH
ncbi:MAG: VanW family protein [Deltaproteobacteria bacterium]|jgi:vancomycin resistance protein YoaR|nr:VanW family protein [Deltaproteobacteria bacterium]